MNTKNTMRRATFIMMMLAMALTGGQGCAIQLPALQPGQTGQTGPATPVGTPQTPVPGIAAKGPAPTAAEVRKEIDADETCFKRALEKLESVAGSYRQNRASADDIETRRVAALATLVHCAAALQNCAKGRNNTALMLGGIGDAAGGTISTARALCACARETAGLVPENVRGTADYGRFQGCTNLLDREILDTKKHGFVSWQIAVDRSAQRRADLERAIEDPALDGGSRTASAATSDASVGGGR